MLTNTGKHFIFTKLSKFIIEFFEIKSFTEQKYDVSLLQQSLASVLNEYLPSWALEFFVTGLGISEASFAYWRLVILQVLEGKARSDGFLELE